VIDSNVNMVNQLNNFERIEELKKLMNHEIDFTGVYTKGDPKDIKTVFEFIKAIVVHGMNNNPDEIGHIVGIEDWSKVIATRKQKLVEDSLDMLEIVLEGW
jgi:hypothetical protein